jgi:hypothetical protein
MSTCPSSAVAILSKAPQERSRELAVVQVGQRLRKGRQRWSVNGCQQVEEKQEDKKSTRGGGGKTYSATTALTVRPSEFRVMSTYLPQASDFWPAPPPQNFQGMATRGVSSEFQFPQAPGFPFCPTGEKGREKKRIGQRI